MVHTSCDHSEAEAKVARLNRTIQQTLSSFPDPIFVLNRELQIEFRNPAAEMLAVNLLFSGVDSLPEEIDDLVEKVMETRLDFLPVLAKESVRFHFNLQDHFYLPRVILLRDDEELIFGVAVILEDITQARLLDEVKTNLIGTVSHELKTPLTSLRLALHVLLGPNAEPLTAKQMELAQTARDEAERLLQTLNNLLDLNRLEHTSDELRLEPMSPRGLLESSLGHIHKLSADAGSRIHLEVEEGLPVVNVEHQRMVFVFDNLLTNALKYSREGSPILVKAGHNEEGDIEFRFKDQGDGIAPDHLIHIFDRFYRVPGTGKSGSGLGLSIAKEIVVAHRGTISANSVVGKGTEFIVVLPAFKSLNRLN